MLVAAPVNRVTREIALVLDASGSVGRHRFNSMVDNVADLMGLLCYRFTDGPSDVRLALLVYGTRVREVFNFQYSARQHTSVQRIKASIRRAKYYYDGRATATGPALRYCYNRIFRSRGTPRIKRRLMVVTDGYSNSGEYPVHVARQLHTRKRVDVYPLGVGTRVNLKELLAMKQTSESNKNLFSQLLLLPDFSSLKSVVDVVRASVRSQPANQQCQKNAFRK